MADRQAPKRRAHLAVAVVVLAVSVGVGSFFGTPNDDSIVEADRERTSSRSKPEQAPKARGGTEQRPARARGRRVRRISPPALVGSERAAAVAILRRAGLRPGAEPRYARRCADPDPRGEVVSQWPAPDEKLREGGRVDLTVDSYVQVRCSAGPVTRACAEDELRLRMYSDRPDFAGGSESALIRLAVVRAGSGGSCRINVPLTLSIPEPDRKGGSVLGSPATLLVRTGLPEGHRLVAEWLWSNWCGKRPAAIGQLAGLVAEGRPRERPSCFGGPSVLELYGLFVEDRPA